MSTGGSWTGPDFLWAEPRDETPAAGVRVAAPAAATRPDGVPGEVGLWVFLLGDMTIFGAFFTVLMVENRQDRGTFAASSDALLQPVGAVNTLVLLLSSFLVVAAVAAHRADRTRAASRLVLGAGACAGAFAGLKITEWSHAVGDDHTPGSDDFYTLYFVLTGVHLLHVVIGSALLAVWWRRARQVRPWGDTRSFVESAAAYWHMVDLLWIGLFTFLYLVPSA